jgi:hypothetical protein
MFAQLSTDSWPPRGNKFVEDVTMRRWTPVPVDLFKTPVSSELPPPQRAPVLDLLKALLKEAISATEGRNQSDSQEAGDDQR